MMPFAEVLEKIGDTHDDGFKVSARTLESIIKWYEDKRIVSLLGKSPTGQRRLEALIVRKGGTVRLTTGFSSGCCSVVCSDKRNWFSRGKLKSKSHEQLDDKRKKWRFLSTRDASVVT